MLKVVVFLLLCQLAASEADAESPVKEVKPPVTVAAPGGTYVGRILTTAGGTKYNVFRGIPYAEPPVGDLRFRKPVSKGKLDSEYDAGEEKSMCIQSNPIPDFGPGGEDCLYLNIFSPSQASDSLHKVFVFIHGGGNTDGMKDMYNPASLVASHDVIVVTINYRLGIMGFMAAKGSSAPGNYGLWDQVEALRWVNNNIRAFGGDPSDVTVGGESAGGFDTTALAITSQAKGLFSRAFPMSGALGVEMAFIIDDPDTLTAMLARREKCLDQDAPSPRNEVEWNLVMNCLRKVPAENISSMADLGEMPMFGPVIDGEYFQKPLKELYADPAYLESIGHHDKDYLVSVCYDEGDLFNVFQDPLKANMSEEEIDGMWKGFVGSFLTIMMGPTSQEVVNRVAKWYEENFEINALADFAADVIFHVPSTEFMNAMSSGWNQDTSRMRYLRFVNFPEFLTGPYKGTQHGIDLVYLFDIDPGMINKVVDYKADGSKWNKEDDDLKEKYLALVASFIKNGKPDAGIEWPAYTQQDGHYLEFSLTPRVLQHLKLDRHELFLEKIPAWMKEFPFTQQAEGEDKRAVDEL